MIPVNEFARRYLEDLLSFFGLNVRVEDSLSDEGTTVELNVPSTGLNGFLIGQHGRNLQSIQYLTNMSVRTKGYEQTVIIVDVAGYKRQQRERLQQKARGIIEQVVSSGQTYTFEPMNPAERRVIHQLATEMGSVASASAGDGLGRHVVLTPLNKAPDTDETAKHTEEPN